MVKSSAMNMFEDSIVNNWFLHAMSMYMDGYEKDEVEEKLTQIARKKKAVPKDRKDARSYNRRQMKKEKKWLRAQRAIHTNGHDSGNPYRLQKGLCGYYTKFHRDDRKTEHRVSNSFNKDFYDAIEAAEYLKDE